MADAGGPVSLLRRSALGPYIFPVIPAEFTNWRDEVRAWKDSCALLEQSYTHDRTAPAWPRDHPAARRDLGQQARSVPGHARPSSWFWPATTAT